MTDSSKEESEGLPTVAIATGYFDDVMGRPHQHNTWVKQNE